MMPNESRFGLIRMGSNLSIALVGNPNSGKTSIFNHITDGYESIGNWAGVTVEKKVGRLPRNLGNCIDLPGVYTLSPLSRDEEVVTRFFLEEQVSGLLNIVDATQLQRHLYLTIQLLEMGMPTILLLNMMDLAKHQGLHIDIQQLGQLLHIPIVPVVARKRKGIEDVLTEIGQLEEYHPQFHLPYGKLESLLIKIEEAIPSHQLPSRWLALQWLEGNRIVEQMLRASLSEEEKERWKQEAEALLDESVEQYIRHCREAWIAGLVQRVVTREDGKSHQFTKQLDQMVLHPYLGILSFFLLIFLIFKATFDWIGGPLSALLEQFLFGPVQAVIAQGLHSMDAHPFLSDMVLEGIIPGVGSVLVFLPQIFTLFFFLSFIEDSGYMARVALVMDKALEKVGLNGKAFIPLLIGFGCNVPGVMAARIIENPKERLITMLITPFMSCSARLAVFTLFIQLFFQEHQALVLLSLYLLSIVVALLTAKVLSRSLTREESSPFVIELPPYRIPYFPILLRSTWEKGKGFLYKAGTFIFAGSVVIWLLSHFGPSGYNVPADESFLAWLGMALAPVFEPLGFGHWQIGVALLSGFLAKEVIISSLNIAFALPDVTQLQALLAQLFTPWQSYSFMVFLMFYIPCIATVRMIRQESGASRWMWLSIGASLGIAYVLAFVIYHGGRLLGFD